MGANESARQAGFNDTTLGHQPSTDRFAVWIRPQTLGPKEVLLKEPGKGLSLWKYLFNILYRVYFFNFLFNLSFSP